MKKKNIAWKPTPTWGEINDVCEVGALHENRVGRSIEC